VPLPLLSSVRAADARAANTDEGTSFGAKGQNNETQLAATLHIGHSALTNASVAKLLELYPNDPYVGCPYNTGDALLPSGRVDKQSNAIYGDIAMHAGVRRPPLSRTCVSCADGISSGARSRS
jgi:hypothetical protein